jgi:hypothetical protein
MSSPRYPIDSDAHLVRRVASVPTGQQVRTWTLRDDNQRHYHGVVSAAESPLYLRLYWRALADAPVSEVGLFRLDLLALLAEDYVRPEDAGGDGDRLRLRFAHLDDGRIVIQWRGDMPALPVGEVGAAR